MGAIFFYDHNKVNGKLDRWWREFCKPPPPTADVWVWRQEYTRPGGGGKKLLHTHLYIDLYWTPMTTTFQERNVKTLNVWILGFKHGNLTGKQIKVRILMHSFARGPP